MDTQLTEIKHYLQEQLLYLENSETSMELQACADEVEFATMVSEAHFKAAIRERSSKMMEEIRTALRRIDIDDYGYCDNCGGDIGVARLKARPTANLCVDCQSEMERRMM